MKPRSSRTPIYITVGAVATLVVLLVALGATGHLIPKPAGTGASTGKILESSGNSYEIPIGQWAAIDFFLSASSTIHGSFTTTDGASTYAFNTSAYDKFQKSGGLDVSGAVWSMGNASRGTYDFQLPGGSWVLVWTTTSQIWGTQIDLVTDLSANPG